MLLTSQEIKVPNNRGGQSILEYFSQFITKELKTGQIPVRFAITQSNADGYNCELGILEEIKNASLPKPTSIFDFMPRDFESTDKFNVVMVVPTGVGAEIGGHAGDATPVARIIASVCDTLVTHPNVVNASDINELPENGLYVEGSVLARLLMGTVGLKRVRKNRTLLAIDKHQDERLEELCINSASAARATLGSDCPEVVKIDPPIHMEAKYSSSGSAVGIIDGLERLCEMWLKHGSEYEALAIASVVKVPEGFHWDYFHSTGEMVNPWGGIEAILTHGISMIFNIPSAHAPMMEDIDIANLHVGIVDPRMSAEAVSTCFLHCVLKGLHRSPQIITDRMLFSHPSILTATDISCVVIPDGCIGLPTLAALEQGIPVIAVRENKNRMQNDLSRLPFKKDKLFIVENYLEAVGVMATLKAGVSSSSVRRPLHETRVVCDMLSSESQKNIAFKKETLSKK